MSKRIVDLLRLKAEARRHEWALAAIEAIGNAVADIYRGQFGMAGSHLERAAKLCHHASESIRWERIVEGEAESIEPENREELSP